MAKYVSGRHKNLKVGIASYSENLTSLEVIGNVGIATTNATSKLYVVGDTIITGVITASSFSGNATTASYATNAGVATYASVAGVATALQNSRTFEITGDIVASPISFDGSGNVSLAATIQPNSVGLGTDTTGNYVASVTNGSYITGADGGSEGSVLTIGVAATSTNTANQVVARDSSGNFSAGTITANLTGTASTASFATTAFNLSNAANITTGTIDSARLSGTYNIDISGNAATSDYADVAGIATYASTAGVATALQNSRTFEITGDIVASPISFNGTGNVSLAATIQPNSVALGSDTIGDYVQTVSGTIGQITVTGGTGEGSTPVISIASNPTLPGNVTVGNDLQVNNNLNVTGNITVGGTAGFILVENFRVSDADIVLGFTTNASNQDVSNDTTANHGGIAVASTEGNPLVNLNIAGIETLPATYKKIMWFKAGSFAGLNTDAWLSNYAIGIGSTQFPSGTRLAAGSVQFTEQDLAVVRNINASGIITGTLANNLTLNTSGTGLSGVATYNNSGATTFTVTSNATSNNTPSTIVARDASGNFSAGTITANLTGTASTAQVATALQNSRTFEITGDIVASPISFDGTGNVSLAATIQPNSVGLGTDTTGNYVASVTNGSYITGGDGGSEGATLTIGVAATSANTTNQVVARDSSGNFSAGTITANLTGTASTASFATTAFNLTDAANITTGTINSSRLTGTYNIDISGNAATSDYAPVAGVATALQNSRTFEITGDIVASPISFDGTGNVSLAATIQPNSVALGGDTTGNYVASVTNGSYITGADGGSEGSVLTIGVAATSSNTASQVVARDASGNFSAGTITANLTGTASTASFATTSYNLTNAANITTGTINSSRLTGTYNIDISGNAATSDYADIAGIATYASNAGIATYADSAGIATVAQNVTGSPNITVSSVNSTGVVTATSFSGSGSNLTGIVTQIIAGTNISIDPVGGTGAVTVNSSAITGVSISTNTTNQSQYLIYSTSTGSTTGFGVSTSGLVFNPSSNNLGIATTNPTSKLYVVGDGYFTGVVTATTFVGNLTGTATTATNLANAENITTGTINSSRLTGTYNIDISGNAATATYATSSGIATYASNSGISTSVIGGIASVTQLNVSGLSTFSNGPVFIGAATSTGTASQPLQVTGGAYVSGNLGIGTTNPTTKLDVSGVIRSGRVDTGNEGGQIELARSTDNATAWYVDVFGNTSTPSFRIVDATALASRLSIDSTGTVSATKFSGDGSLLTGIAAGIAVQDEGSTVGTSVTTLNFSGASVSVSNAVNGISTVTVTASGIVTYVDNAGIATNLKGGLAGNIPYQSAPDTTTFLTNGSSGTILQSNGVGNAPSWVTAAPAGAITGLTIRDEGTIVGGANSVSQLNFVGNIVSVASTSGIATVTFLDYVSNAGVSTYATSSGIATYATSSGIATYATSAGIATYATSAGISTYASTAGVATALQNARTFEITGDIVASPISFNGTGNVSLAATIQPNSVALGSDTTGDYVQSISGTSNQITVTSGTGESSTPTLSIPSQFTAPQDVTVTRDLQVNRNLNVNGNITIGGTSATIFSQTLNIYDPDIVLGYRTDGSGNDVSNDNTANHGGVALASTEGTPLVQLFIAGIETNPATYKKIMWFKAGTFSGLGTDAWLANYAVGIGSTQFPTGTRLAAGNVQFTQSDLAVVRNINASGIITGTLANTLTLNTSGTGLSGSTTYNNSGAATFTVTSNATSANTASTIVARDASGNFSAGTITANLTGTASLATYATNAGTSTSVIGGIASVTQLNVSGVSTFSNNIIQTSGSVGLGTTNPLQRFQIGTANTLGINTTGTVFVVKSNADVGIGTTNPTSKLHVIGDVRVTGVVTATSFSGSLVGVATTALNLNRDVTAGSGLTGGGTLTSNVTLNVGAGSGIAVNADDVQLKNASSLTNNRITKWDSSNTQLTNSVVSDDGTNVGVGSTQPFAKFDVAGNIAFNSTTLVGSATSTLATVTQTGIHSSLSTSTYRSVEYTIQATQGTNYHTTKILALHNGTTAYHSEYATIFNNSSVASFDVDVSGGNIRLLATGASSSSTNYVINFIATRS